VSDAGEGFAGGGLAGAGEPWEGAVVVQKAPPVALAYSDDGDVPINGDGLYGSLHPIDQRVRLALLPPLGSIPAEPTLGLDWATPFETGEKLRADVVDRIRNALFRAGITSAEVEEKRIIVERKPRVSWQYEYVNLQTAQPQTVTYG
jgi:hypothetical protein